MTRYLFEVPSSFVRFRTGGGGHITPPANLPHPPLPTNSFFSTHATIFKEFSLIKVGNIESAECYSLTALDTTNVYQIRFVKNRVVNRDNFSR